MNRFSPIYFLTRNTNNYNFEFLGEGLMLLNVALMRAWLNVYDERKITQILRIDLGIRLVAH